MRGQRLALLYRSQFRFQAATYVPEGGGGNYVGGISRNDKNGPEIAPRRTGNQTIQHF